MSLLQRTDLYRSQTEKADRKNVVYGFIALVLIALAVALVIAGAFFPDTFRPSVEFLLTGP